MNRIMGKGMYLFLAAALIVGLALIAGPVPIAQAAPVYPTCTVGSSGADYITISDALADSGCTTINVAAGPYNVSSTIVVNRAVIISGPVGGGAIVQGTNSAAVSIFEIAASGVTIQNLEITHSALTPGLPIIPPATTWEELPNSLIRIPAGSALSAIAITGNTIYVPLQSGAMSAWNGVGITVGSGPVSDISITGNTIYNTRDGVVVHYNNTATISNNTIYNTKGGIMNYTGSQADADNRTMSGNTWGTVHNEWDIVWNSGGGPYEPDYHQSVLVLSGANNDAYVLSKMTTSTTPTLLTGNRSHIFVNVATGTSTKNWGSGNMNQPYATIALGVEAVVPGGTVYVAAGTYVENVAVTKSVTIIGAGQASTFVKPTISSPNCGGVAGGSLCAGSSNVFLIQADNVTIQDLTIDGDNPALTSGIVQSGADLDARNGIITNHALGVYNNLVVHHVTIKNIYLRGIYASTGGTFNLHHNVIQNVKGENQSIGIFNWNGAGIISDNNVSDVNDAIAANWSLGTQFLRNTVTDSSSGLHTDNNGGMGVGGSADLLQDNAVSNCKTNGYGMFVFAPYLAVTVNHNTVTNCAVGLALSGQQAVVTPLFTNNTVDGQGLSNATGVYVTTDLWGWGYANVAGSFTGNQVVGNDTGFYLEQVSGKDLALTGSNNQITGNKYGVQIPAPTMLMAANAAAGRPLPNANVRDEIPGADKQLKGIYGGDAASPAATDAVTKVTLSHNDLSANTEFGVTNGGSAVVNAENNYWGAVNGPGPVGPGSGAAVSTNVDYQPWCNADFSRCDYYPQGTISMQVPPAQVEVGDTVTMDSQVTADGVYGMQLNVQFNATNLQFVSGIKNNASAGWYWDYPIENFAPVSGGVRVSGTMKEPPHANPATLTGESVATWTFKCLQPGTHNLTYSATSGSGTYLATKAAFEIPTTLTGATVKCIPTTASVNGYIKLQGRLNTELSPKGWYNSIVTLTCVSGSCTTPLHAPYVLAPTDYQGKYELVKGDPGTGILLGTYSASVTRRGYLGATKASNVTIVAGSNTINTSATAPTLLGGDWTADFGVIDILDLSGMGGSFGSEVTTADTGPDINGDKWVNIFDLVMVGGNFGKTTSLWTP